MDYLSPHDLRHTAASLAVQSVASVKAVQRMLGHASAVMTLDVLSLIQIYEPTRHISRSRKKYKS